MAGPSTHVVRCLSLPRLGDTLPDLTAPNLRTIQTLDAKESPKDVPEQQIEPTEEAGNITPAPRFPNRTLEEEAAPLNYAVLDARTAVRSAIHGAAVGNSPKVESPKAAGPTTDGPGAGGPRHRMKDAAAKARKDLREGAEKVADAREKVHAGASQGRDGATSQRRGAGKQSGE